MCRWLAYLGEPRFLEALVTQPEHSLIQQSLHARKGLVTTNGDGFGLGWYGEREVPGVYRETLPAWNDRNLRSLCHQIRSGLFFAHVRASTGTATTRANCHPFNHGRWMFMHNGQIGGYERLRRRLEAAIPDELYLAREGTTDSEVFFLMLLANGLEQDADGALRRTVRQVHEAMAGAGIVEPFRLTAALTNGRHVAAVRYASDHQPPSLFWCRADGQTIIVSEPLDTGRQPWHEVPVDHILLAEPGGEVRVEPFAPM
jgi:glutamine amidotransferase